ncbi:MAG: glucose 1-dehydrogenase [Nitrospirae bacterium]|nr:MAG: glucose 1-dehydrogenase [Nitrospirota bacterium]
MKIDLKDRVALVTGASRGIGREIAIALGRAGATVIVNYTKSEEKAKEVAEEINRAGSRAETFKADVSNPDDVEGLFRFIVDRFGVLHILVNNAGVIRDTLLASMRLSDWDKVVDTNLRGAFLCMQKAAEIMMPRGKGKIINISSVSAIRGGRGQTNYAAAKGGLISLTRSASVELAGKGIQVNAVLPGFIDTDMSRRVRKRAGERILEEIPIGRFGNPEDVAPLVVFLSSDYADYITGQAVAVDGGMSAR